jgi:hypothetical protein
MSKPVIVEVSYNEYVQKTSSGEIAKFWKEKPETMLKKVAESQALRKAFDITGLYAEEELEPITKEARVADTEIIQQIDAFDASTGEVVEVSLDDL